MLDEAVERAADATAAEARARVERELVRLHADPARGLEPARARAADAGARGCSTDDLGRCRAWRLRAWVEWTESQVRERRRGLAARRRSTRAAPATSASGSRSSAGAPRPPRSARCRSTRGSAVHGDRRARCATARSRSAVALRPLALLRALTGDFDEARRLIAEANAILGELGRLHSSISHHEAQVEMLAGAPATAAARLQARPRPARARWASGHCSPPPPRCSPRRATSRVATTRREALRRAQRAIGRARGPQRPRRCGAASARACSPAAARYDEAEALAREAVALVDADRRADRPGRRAARARRDPRAARPARRRGRRRARGARSLHPQGSGGAGGPGTVRRPPLRTTGRRR